MLYIDSFKKSRRKTAQLLDGAAVELRIIYRNIRRLAQTLFEFINTHTHTQIKSSIKIKKVMKRNLYTCLERLYTRRDVLTLKTCFYRRNVSFIAFKNNLSKISISIYFLSKRENKFFVSKK